MMGENGRSLLDLREGPVFSLDGRIAAGGWHVEKNI